MDAVRAGALFAGMLGILEGKSTRISMEVKKECLGKTLRVAKTIFESKIECYVKNEMPGAPDEVYDSLVTPVSYTHLRAHETNANVVFRASSC